MPAWSELPVFAITLALMLVGLFGLLVPVFPGMMVMWLAALGYGIITQAFDRLGFILFAAITVLMLIGVTIDNVLMGLSANKGGASWKVLGLAGLAGILGTIMLPPIGGLIGAPLTILLLEYRRQQDWQKAWAALRGLAVGWGLAFIVRFGLGVLMIILWVIWDWQG